jgi:hypothetical protein
MHIREDLLRLDAEPPESLTSICWSEPLVSIFVSFLLLREIKLTTLILPFLQF